MAPRQSVGSIKQATPRPAGLLYLPALGDGWHGLVLSTWDVGNEVPLLVHSQGMSSRSPMCLARQMQHPES